MNPKQFIKLFIPPFVLLIITKLRIKKSFLQKYILELLNDRTGYYIELGANDGVIQSNTFYLEKKGWKGILIEPSLNKYFECTKNRSSLNKFYCNACVSVDFNEKYVDMTYSNLMTVAPQISSKKDNLTTFLNSSKKHLKPYEKLIEYGARAITLNDILKDAKAPSFIDFFSLDVEGAEIEVLKGVNFDNFKFRYVLIETEQFKLINDFFIDKGYQLLDKVTHHDYIFKYNDNLQ